MTLRKDSRGARTFRRRLLYGLSLPERVARSAAGVFGGTLRDSADVLLPQALRNAKTYQVLVGQMLDFLAEDVGRVGDAPAAARSDGFLAGKIVGNFIDVASLATLHLSPMLILAVIGDMAYGSKTYLREFADELQRQGLVADAGRVHDVDNLLEQIASASHDATDLFDQPPLSMDGLKESIAQARRSLLGIDASKIVSKNELDKLWNTMREVSRRDGVSALRVSGLATLGALDKVGKLGDGALSSAQAAGVLFHRHVLAHYRVALAEVEERGFYGSLAVFGKPYAQAAWRNFSPERVTLTETVVGDAAARLLEKARRAP